MTAAIFTLTAMILGCLLGIVVQIKVIDRDVVAGHDVIVEQTKVLIDINNTLLLSRAREAANAVH
jgi:hypothetical protein